MQYYTNRTILTAGVALTFLLGGCTLEEAKDTATPAVTLAETKSAVAASQPVSSSQADHADHPGHENHAKTESEAPVAPPVAGGPMMGMADPMAPLTPTPEMDTAIKEADKGGDKAKIAGAYTKRGIFRMNDAKAGARMKYRAALSDLRKALAAAPDQAEAKQAKEQIEGIYASMGRPVPTDDVP